MSALHGGRGGITQLGLSQACSDRRGIGRDRCWPAVLALLVMLVVVTIQSRPAGASGTRYLDPIFSGDLAPVTEFSYDPSIPLNKQQRLTVKAWAGSYTLSAGGSTTSPIPATAPAASVQAALHALPSLDFDGTPGGDVVVTGGPGGVFGGRHYDISFTAPAPPGGYPRLTATNVNLVNPLGPAVVVQCLRCGDVYRPDEPAPPAGGRPVVLIAHSGGFVLGAKDSASGDITGPRMERWATELAGRGYVAVPINYSLAQPDDLAAVFSCEWDAPAEPGTPCPDVVINAARAIQHDI
ncbi:MAG: hypothetical protein N2037_08385, partial [Acidimicrobiales bacterium]|nr:hypothetical protein [Acidimicrobiales bacterium]